MENVQQVSVIVCVDAGQKGELPPSWERLETLINFPGFVLDRSVAPVRYEGWVGDDIVDIANGDRWEIAGLLDMQLADAFSENPYVESVSASLPAFRTDIARLIGEYNPPSPVPSEGDQGNHNS